VNDSKHQALIAILRNPDDGAAELLLRTVRWLREHPAALREPAAGQTFRILRQTRPAMPVFANLAGQLEPAAAAARPAALGAIAEELASAEARIAESFRNVLLAGRTLRLASLSWSSTVFSALSHARDLVQILHVLESHPGGEGRRLYERCRPVIGDVRLRPDVELPAVVEASDAGVIGADTLFADGAVLNKVLSTSLAEALARQQKPLFVLASRWKASPRPGAEYAGTGPDRALFEVVPAHRITRIITEAG
jgi:translation initiation factor 2B subunit (eIF-2B alpha/beta/delta family)